MDSTWLLTGEGYPWPEKQVVDEENEAFLQKQRGLRTELHGIIEEHFTHFERCSPFAQAMVIRTWNQIVTALRNRYELPKDYEDRLGLNPFHTKAAEIVGAFLAYPIDQLPWIDDEVVLADEYVLLSCQAIVGLLQSAADSGFGVTVPEIDDTEGISDFLFQRGSPWPYGE